MDIGDRIIVKETPRALSHGLGGHRGFVESIGIDYDLGEPSHQVLVYDLDGGLAGPYTLYEDDLVLDI